MNIASVTFCSFQAARATDRKIAETKWEEFVKHISWQRLSDKQIKDLIETLDCEKQWAPLHYAVDANNGFVSKKLTGSDKRFRCGALDRLFHTLNTINYIFLDSDINIQGGNGENVLHVVARSKHIWTCVSFFA